MAVQFIASTSAAALTGSSARLIIVLERLTLPLRIALSAQEASSLVGTTVRGALRPRVDGEQLLFRWKSGAERMFRPGQYRPALQAGTRMKLRNAENDPLVLYRVTLTFTASAATTAGTPELAPQHPSRQRDPGMTPEISR